MTTPYGATPADWNHFTLVLGLTADLLPVVSNPHATISPNSKMKSLGKTPSRYYGSTVGGIARWTQQQATDADIAEWMQQPDYGICIQTKHIRALDVDIPDNQEIAENVHAEIKKFLKQVLPRRHREDSTKFLLAFTLEGEYTKRTITTDYGIIEFLAGGQQFIAAGTHPDGARYVWDNGVLPEDIPVLPAERFEALWTHLHACFGVGEATQEPQTTRHQKLNEAIENDPIAQYLLAKEVVRSTERDGRLHIECPFASEHTDDTSESATSYFPARTGGFERGQFKCLHAHCARRTRSEFLDQLGYDETADDFTELEDAGTTDSGEEKTDTAPERFEIESAETFGKRAPPTWIIKNVLPRAALAIVFGESGSGKTFLALDMALAISGGTPWRTLRTKQGRVVYIAAEDENGVRQRLQAHRTAYGTSFDVMPGILPDAPNFMNTTDVRDVVKAIQRFGGADVVFVDTWAQVTPGANENSGEDMGQALKHCRVIHKYTGALVVLIHHSGKDATKGARGWSGLRGAADCMLEVARNEDEREAIIYKLKNAPDGARFGFKLKTVELGVDEDLEPITSCVVEHGERINREKKKGHGKHEDLVMRVINDLSIGGDVTVAEVINEAVNRTPFDAASGRRDQRRLLINRALVALTDRGSVLAKDNMLSIPDA